MGLTKAQLAKEVTALKGILDKDWKFPYVYREEDNQFIAFSSYVLVSVTFKSPKYSETLSSLLEKGDLLRVKQGLSENVYKVLDKPAEESFGFTVNGSYLQAVSRCFGALGVPMEYEGGIFFLCFKGETSEVSIKAKIAGMKR